MTLTGERIPNGNKVQHESRYGSFIHDGGSASPGFCFEAGPINFDSSRLRVNQPGEVSPIGQPFFHLVPKHSNTVNLRSQLDHEVGTHRPVKAKGARIEILDSLNLTPGDIRSPARSVLQQPAGRRIECHSVLILDLVAKLGANPILAGPGPGVCLGQDDEFPGGGHFKIKVQMLGAQLHERFFHHQADPQNGGQAALIDDERHTTQRMSGLKDGAA